MDRDQDNSLFELEELPPSPKNTFKSATFAPDAEHKSYRYDLTRAWTPHPTKWVQWVMLNPSIGSDTADDQTLRRCIDFSQQLGFDGMFVNNLFGLISTSPTALLKAADPVGAENDLWIASRSSQSQLTIVAWGTGPKHNWAPFDQRVKEVMDLVQNPHALALTNDGMPRHPSRLARSMRPQPFELPTLEQQRSTIGIDL